MRSSAHLWRVGVALAIASAALTACSDDDSGSEDATASTSTTATTAAPATSTTRAAAERSTIVGLEGVLGYWLDGRWVQAQTGQPVPITPGDGFTLVRLAGDPSSATVRGIKEENEYCRNTLVTFDPPFPDPSGGDDLMPIGVTDVDDPQVRPVEVLDPGAEAYRSAASDVLAGLGIDDPDPTVVQVVRADLADDGTDEVLVVAERLDDTRAVFGQPGDYSVLFLRQVVDGEVRTTVLEQFYKDPAKEAQEPSPYIVMSRVSAVADLNGDGVMEVVVQERYYEGSATVVRALDADGSLDEVIAAGCGI